MNDRGGDGFIEDFPFQHKQVMSLPYAVDVVSCSWAYGLPAAILLHIHPNPDHSNI